MACFRQIGNGLFVAKHVMASFRQICALGKFAIAFDANL